MILIERPLDMGEAQLAKDTEKRDQPSCGPLGSSVFRQKVRNDEYGRNS